MDFKKVHNLIPILIQLQGIYVLSLGIISVISGKLIENISFFQLHIGGTASILIGIFMVTVGNGLRARTRISWYFAIFLILSSLFSISVRRFSIIQIHFDIIAISINILTLSILLIYQKDYIFPSRIILSKENKLALYIIFISSIYGLIGTLLLGDQFRPHIHDLYTAIYYTLSVLSTLGLGDILPITNTSRLFTVSLSVLGIASFLGALTTFIEPLLQERINKVVNIMEAIEFTGFGDHIIFCGYSPLWSEFLKSMKYKNIPMVILVSDQEISTKLKNEGYIVFREYAEDIDVLLRVGLKKAKHIYICSTNDADNLLVALTIQKFKKQEHLTCKITTIVNNSKNADKFQDMSDEIIDIAKVLNDYIRN